MLLILLVQYNSYSQDTLKHKIDEVIITAGRRPISFDIVNRSFIVIDYQQIKHSPVNALLDILKYAGGIDLRKRGVNGTQADVSIRGGTFEQTLVLIDGVKMTDPQTGHYSLNLPLTSASVERIEILKGEGSRIYGPNAFSGAINFITRKDRTKNLSLQLSGGQNGFYSAMIWGSYKLGNWGNNISIEKSKSDGYRENTEFDIINLSYNTSLTLSNCVLNLFFGLNEKDIGANNFYTDKYPLQTDYTKTRLLIFSGEFGDDELSITPKLYWRRNNDEFLLDKYNPDFYRNLHETNVHGGEIQATIKSIIGKTSLGAEYTADRIESSNLGTHNQQSKGIFVEQSFDSVENFNITIGGFAYNYPSIGWRLWPGFDIGYRLSRKLRIFLSVGKAFRMPTYTGLYYSDPVTAGNSNLKHEETVNYSAGLRYKSIPIELGLNLFRKEGENIIDWVKVTEPDKWTAQNIATSNTNGFEISLLVKAENYFNEPFISSIGISYTYLDSDRKTIAYRSRYVSDYLKHQLIIDIAHSFYFDIFFNWLLRYENRVGFSDYILGDLKIRKSIDQIQLFIKGTNIFNTPHKDIVGIPLPGRWLIGGVKFSLILI